MDSPSVTPAYTREPAATTQIERCNALRIRGEPNRGGSYCLLAGEIDGRLLVLKREISVNLKVARHALDHLESYVVQSRASRDEILGGFLIASTYLDPFVSAQVISGPYLAALILAPDPVAEDLTLVRVALPLDDFNIHEIAAITGGNGRIGRCRFDAHVQFRNTREVGKV